MRRIKIIKMVNKVDYDSDESTQTLTHMSEGIDWHEVDDKKYKEIIELINFANMYRYQLKANYELKMIEEVLPESVEEYLEEAKALKLQIEEKKRKEAEKAEKARIAREEKRKITEVERKRKQLEKLQKELGEQNA